MFHRNIASITSSFNYWIDPSNPAKFATIAPYLVGRAGEEVKKNRFY